MRFSLATDGASSLDSESLKFLLFLTSGRCLDGDVGVIFRKKDVRMMKMLCIVLDKSIAK